MKRGHVLWLLPLLGLVAAHAAADDAAPLSALAKMPVKEVTVFKDGHAFVLHEGNMPVDAAGDVRMDYLPTPVLGTFWPYSADKNVRLTAVTASPRRVLVARTALTIKDLLEANPGAQINLYDPVDQKRYTAQIVEVPSRSADELEKTSPPDSGEKLPEKSSLIMLKRSEGVQVVGLDRIQEMTFLGPYKKTMESEEFRNLLTLKLDWQGARPGKTAHVGMVYVQKGIRWIPGYKISLDDKGNAAIRLQATLLNEMTDLDDVTLNLVIGVPSFFFQDTPDPISLQQAFAQLSPYFQSGTQMGFAMSNSMMGQVARQGERFGAPAEAAGGNTGLEVGGADRNEDLFVFTVKHVTLKKGQRAVIPVAEMTVKVKDIYTLDLPYAPPREIQTQVRSEQQTELLRLANRPKVMHKIRLANRSKFPLTTAPALIVNGDRVVAQAMMTYTAVGADVDLSLTTAVDINVKKSDRETGRTPNAVQWQGNAYERVDLAGTVTLTNFRTEATEIEVTRNVLGNAGKADNSGSTQMVNVFEDDSYASTAQTPAWWGSYSWPAWWGHFNGIGRINWKVKLEPGKSVDLGYTWHYFWR
jgi:hypothetical protein